MGYKEIEGDLIKLAKEGYFDVITHGCNCFCTMGAGIAPQMAEAFGCDMFPKELLYTNEIGLDGLIHTVPSNNRGDINKLGTIDYLTHIRYKPDDVGEPFSLSVVNSYTQYSYGKNHKDGVLKPIDYEALTMCMRKINHIFKGKRIGLPKIGSGLAGGDWNIIKEIIINELKDCDVTVVIYKKN